MSRGGAPKLNYLDAVKCSMPGVRGDRQRQDRRDGERKRAIGFTRLGPLPTVPCLDALSASKAFTVPRNVRCRVASYLRERQPRRTVGTRNQATALECTFFQ